MQRRTFVSTALAVAGVTALAGCTDGAGEDDGPGGYETGTYDGRDVPLAPLADVHEWYEDGTVRIVDTRGPGQYGSGHIEGAVLSPPPSDGDRDDPLADWDREDRIVTYCDCPHSLAVMRGSQLLADGFEAVYALDDGFPAWEEAGYPVESDTEAEIETHRIVGESDPRHAEDYVWVRTADGDQVEIAQIEADGSYELTIRFADVDADSLLHLEAPDYEREATLGVLTSGPVVA